MTDWREVWIRKGSSPSRDLKELDGFEATTIDPCAAAARISETLELAPTDTLLEVGCGAGMIAQYLHCRYFGIDYSPSLLDRHRDILGNPVSLAEASHLPFPDQSFDHVLAYSVFHYFPSQEYAGLVCREMERIAKRSVFIGDLPMQSHNSDHLLFERNFLEGWQTSDGYYTSNRFNVFRISK
jgi:ubiquinone/menaquinone biosynthesis C-methylase UbiE